MRTIKYLTSFILSLVLMSTLSSCNDWLAVDMEDAIMEDQIFSDDDGYKAVLNGVYVKMNNNYATTLTTTVIDVMAQYWDVRQNSNHKFFVYADYDFTDETFESTNESVWTNQYNQIANLNNLIEHIDAADTKISATYHDLIKGEALALRAFLHFDLMRLYGPIYSEETKATTCIPYQETSSKEIQPLLPAQTVMEKVIRDLNDALGLLVNDPIRTEGVMAEDSEDPNGTNDLRYRQYRLNYYAVKALLARAYLWIGDKDKALTEAKELIAENEERSIFVWTPKADVQTSTNPDRLFSTEVIFGLYDSSRETVYDSYFNHTADYNTVLTFKGETLEAVDGKMTYFYNDNNDIRRGSNFWSEEELEQTSDFGSSTQKAVCFGKYADISSSDAFRYMIPLIRMSEIYLIAAECTDDLSEAISYINKIRVNRNCVNLELTEDDNEETIQSYITNEFMREVIGEGQLYFYYKRLGMEEILSGSTFEVDEYWGDLYITEEMALSDYVWPLPKAETDKRVNAD